MTIEYADPTHPDTKARFKAKAPSEYSDPCQDAASKSIRCMTRNPGNKDLCSDYFQAYRDCKKKWIQERKEERRRTTKMSLF